MEENKLPVFAERLNMLREAAGDLVEDMARKTGVSHSTLSLYLGGKRLPNIEILARIAKAYDISSDTLLGLKDRMNMEAARLVLGITQEDAETIIRLNRAGLMGHVTRACEAVLPYYEEADHAEEEKDQ